MQTNALQDHKQSPPIATMVSPALLLGLQATKGNTLPPLPGDKVARVAGAADDAGDQQTLVRTSPSHAL